MRKVGDYTGEKEKVWSRWVARIEPQATKKFFGAAVFQKCCRGVGEQPTFAKQIRLCNLFFLLQLHFLKLTNSQFHDFYETSCKFRQGNGAAGKSRGEPRFCLRLSFCNLSQKQARPTARLMPQPEHCFRQCGVVFACFARSYSRRKNDLSTR